MSDNPKSKSKIIQWFIDHVMKLETFAKIGLVGMLFSGIFAGDVRSVIGYLYNVVYQNLFDNSVHDCDQQAADPDDQQRSGQGVPTYSLSQSAMGTCEAAVNIDGSNKIKHQYARVMYQFGNRKQKQDAMEIYNELVAEKYVASFGRLGSILLKTGDLNRAIEILKEGSVRGSSVAQFQLGNAYLRGYPGVLDQNHSEGMELIREAARQNNNDAVMFMTRQGAN